MKPLTPSHENRRVRTTPTTVTASWANKRPGFWSRKTSNPAASITTAPPTRIATGIPVSTNISARPAGISAYRGDSRRQPRAQTSSEPSPVVRVRNEPTCSVDIPGSCIGRCGPDVEGPGKPRNGSGPGREGSAEPGYRSTSPTTKKIEPKIAIRSGTRVPGSIAGITLTFENEAVRILSRYG